MALLIQLVSGECPRHRNICVIHNFALLVCITPFSELIHFHDYLEGFILIKEKASFNTWKTGNQFVISMIQSNLVPKRNKVYMLFSVFEIVNVTVSLQCLQSLIIWNMSNSSMLTISFSSPYTRKSPLYMFSAW